MKVEKFNEFFGKVGQAQIRNRWKILAALLIVTVVCCLGLSNFSLALGEEGWFGNSDEITINTKKYEETFGNLNGIGVLVVKQGEGDVFSEDMLKVIEKIGNRMRDEIPFADRLTSIVEVDIPVGNDEGFSIVKPYENGIPSDSAGLAKARDLVMRGSEKTNALINSLVSDDGKETWISLSLHPFKGKELEEKYGGDNTEVSTDIGYKLMNIIESEEFQNKGFKLYGGGMPYDSANEDRYEVPEYGVRVLCSIVVMLLFLAICLRNVFGVIVPAVATISAIATVFGAMSFFGEKADSALVTLPVVLGMALAVGYSVHYIKMFKLHFRRTGKRKESAIKCVEECGWPVLFTVLTTMASFISFLFVNMKPLEWMGKTSAFIVLAIYIYVTVLIPILLSFGKDRAPRATQVNGATKLDLSFSRWSKFVHDRKKSFIVISALVIAAFIPGMFKITAQLDYLTITGDKMPYIQEVKKMLAQKLGNQYSYTVMISYDEEGAFKKPENMKALVQLEDYLGTLSLTKWSGGKARVSSATSILKEMNRALNEGKDSMYTVPEDEYVLAQLMELSSIEMHNDFSDVMDDDFKTTVVSVDMTQFATEEALANMEALKAKLTELFPGAKCTLLGDMIRYSEMSNRIIFGGLKSFGFSLVIIAIMLVFAFSSLKLGLIGMIPNVAPVILVGGVMGYFNYALDFSTITVMPMILGIAVDDTIHLTTHLKMKYEQMGSSEKAMETTFREIGATMFLTTVILCSMFSVYLFSPMHFLAVLGVLIIVGLSSALVADYTITPALLHVAKPFGKEKEEV
ncbi:RND transporter [Fibrobacter sp. UWB2]|uniref:efflux RND transporter permease subunit n=1 Tax=Fibrobacter sp. UWB2 TaxID=1964358 RepID=UPI000B521730|nr:MMPL family transporter [Fibrobacter sp. UWB2]OWV24235.1 RND transporter [Fibrobacter sp. UWB2]